MTKDFKFKIFTYKIVKYLRSCITDGVNARRSPPGPPLYVISIHGEFYSRREVNIQIHLYNLFFFL